MALLTLEKMLRGVVHNAKRATYDGRDLWIASLHRPGGGVVLGSIQPVESVEEGKRWLNKLAADHGIPRLHIDVMGSDDRRSTDEK